MFALMPNSLTWPAIGDRLAAKGRGAKNQLARTLDMDPSDLARRIKRGGEPTASQLAKIEEFLEGSAAPETSATVTQLTRRIPVYGYAAAGGEDHVAMATNQVLDYVDLPANLARGDAFIVRSTGESMFPRYKSGEMALIEVDVPPVRNDDVLVELNDETGLLKEYRGQKDGYLLLWQYNPERELKIPLTKVRRMHAAMPWRRR